MISAILAAIREKEVFFSHPISVLPARGFPGTRTGREGIVHCLLSLRCAWCQRVLLESSWALGKEFSLEILTWEYSLSFLPLF